MIDAFESWANDKLGEMHRMGVLDLVGYAADGVQDEIGAVTFLRTCLAEMRTWKSGTQAAYHTKQNLYRSLESAEILQQAYAGATLSVIAEKAMRFSEDWTILQQSLLFARMASDPEISNSALGLLASLQSLTLLG